MIGLFGLWVNCPSSGPCLYSNMSNGFMYQEHKILNSACFVLNTIAYEFVNEQLCLFGLGLFV